MEKNIKNIKKLALGSELFVDPKISFLAEGYGNYNYLIEEGGQKFVLRIKKSKEAQFADSLEREFIFLQYFNQKEINFVPKALYFSRKNNFQIQTFLEGEKVAQKDFTNQQIELFAKQLHELFSLDIDEFYKFCELHGYKIFEKRDQIASLKIYGFNRFKETDKKKIDNSIAEWIKRNLRENHEILKKSQKRRRYGFLWGDVQGKLIINKNGEMFFYDFEHTRIENGKDLCYIKIHGKFDDNQFAHLVRCYAKYSGEGIENISEEMDQSEKITRVNDVVWAAMKWSKSEDEKDKERFKELTYKRIKLAEK